MMRSGTGVLISSDWMYPSRLRRLRTRPSWSPGRPASASRAAERSPPPPARSRPPTGRRSRRTPPAPAPRAGSCCACARGGCAFARGRSRMNWESDRKRIPGAVVCRHFAQPEPESLMHQAFARPPTVPAIGLNEYIQALPIVLPVEGPPDAPAQRRICRLGRSVTDRSQGPRAGVLGPWRSRTGSPSVASASRCAGWWPASRTGV